MKEFLTKGEKQMKKEWTVTDSMGTVHKVECRMGGFGGNKIIVDNDSYKFKSSNFFIMLLDYRIDLPGLVCNVVIIGNKIRLAVNGVFLDDGTPYEPVSKAPTWVWILVAVSCVGGWFFAGLIGMCIGIFASIFAVQNALQKKTVPAIIFFAGSIVINVLVFFLVSSALL